MHDLDQRLLVERLAETRFNELTVSMLAKDLILPHTKILSIVNRNYKGKASYLYRVFWVLTDKPNLSHAAENPWRKP